MSFLKQFFSFLQYRQLSLQIRLLLFFVLIPFPLIADHVHEDHAIAVLNQRGSDASFAQWKKTLDFLNQRLPAHHFYLVPLSDLDLEDAIARQNISFILTDALQTSRLYNQYQYKPILSLKPHYQEQPYSKDAGVLVTLSKKTHLVNASDINHERIVATSYKSLSFNSVWSNVLDAIPNLKERSHQVEFLGFPEDDVLYALLDGKADIGIVSAGLLERMSQAWQINSDDFRVLNQQDTKHPFLHSSALYPPWALSANIRLDKDLIKAIQSALLHRSRQQATEQIHPSGDRYAWQTALDYHSLSHRLDDHYHHQTGGVVTAFTQLTLSSPMIIWLSIMVLLLLLLPSSCYSRHSLIVYSFTIGLLILIGSIFYQFYQLWVEDYQNQQVQIAKSNVRGTAETIHTYIYQRQLVAQRFALEYQDVLQDPFVFAQYPPNPQRLHFEKSLHTQFPDLFKYAVFDDQSNVLYSTDQSSVSFLCENNIRTHWKTAQNNTLYATSSRHDIDNDSVMIHGHDHSNYHFDLLVPLKDNMVLMISLKIEALLDMLRHANIAGQNLIVVKNNHRDQIELSAEGVQHSLTYGHYLDGLENADFLYGTHIKKTAWYLVALSQKGWFEQYSIRLQTWIIAVYSLIVLILFIFVRRLTRETYLREYLQANNQAQSNQRYKILLEHAVDAFISTDEFGNIDEFNPAAERMLGYDKKVIQGQNFCILMPEEHAMQQQNDAYLRSYLENQSSHQLGYHLKAKHKHGFYFPVYMTLMDTGISGTYRYGIMLKDMTVLKRSEERLNATRERLQYALDGANEGYWDWDINSGKVYFSPSWEAILGYQSGELQPNINTLKGKIHPEDKPRVKRLLRAHFEGKNAYYKVEYRLENKQGEWVWTLGRGKVVSRDALGQPLRMVGTTSNIQERKNLEHALQQAKEQAEKTAAAKSQFLSNMSHEIRTPLNGVLGMAQLLKKTQLNSKQCEYISLILDSGDALMTIINDILDLSKLESKQITLEHISFNLENLLHDILCINRQTAQEKGIFLLLEYPHHTAKYFLGDPTRLKQIINNLINNALKFTQQGYVHIRVQSNPHADKDQHNDMLIQVIDTGIGIPTAQQAHIFKNFTQADNSTTRKYGGTGLGLAICKQLSKQMHGNIQVESEVGKGCCFSLNMPLESNHEQVITETFSDLSGKHLLLFNAHSLSRHIFLQILTSAKAQVDVCTELNQLQCQLQQAMQDYDALILVNHDSDFHINTFTNKLQDAYPKLPMLTINGFDHDIAQGYELQMHEPFRAQQLLLCISQLCQKHLATNAMAIDNHKSNTNTLSHETIQGLSDLRVLVVEDIPLNQRIVTDMLKQYEMKIDCVNDGLEAIEAWQQENYDVILMDCRMPNMDGYTATAKIRELEQQQQKNRIPIFALTANALLEDIKKCKAVGMDNVITKPIQQEQLKQNLLKWLKKPTEETSKESMAPTLVLDAPILDSRHIEQLQTGLADGFMEIISEASQTLEELFNQFQENCNQQKAQQYKSCRHMMHNIKSTALTLGLLRLGQYATFIEQHLADLDRHSLNQHLQDMHTLQQQNLMQLQAYLEKN